MKYFFFILSSVVLGLSTVPVRAQDPPNEIAPETWQVNRLLDELYASIEFFRAMGFSVLSLERAFEDQRQQAWRHYGIGFLAPSGFSIGPGSRFPYEFGKGYMRIYVTGVNLPVTRDQESFFVTVKTGNKRSLEFKAAFEPKPRSRVSAHAEIPVVPYVAINTKAPLMVFTELRRKKRISEPIDLIGGLLSTVSSVFTGGAAATLTRLGTYAKATGDLVRDYENRTESSDFNGNVIFDENLKNYISRERMSSYFYVFTGGKSYFTAYTSEGKEKHITESMVIDAQPVNNTQDGDGKYL